MLVALNLVVVQSDRGEELHYLISSLLIFVALNLILVIRILLYN